METFYDYKKFYVLYVDDEEKSLKYFRENFGDKFTILTALNAEEGYRILVENQDHIAVLMTDQRMPGEKGIQLLEKSRLLNPRIIRILVTAYSDLETAVSAVNTGAIYKYVTKPWDVPQLEVTLKRGMEFFMVQDERDQLLRQKMSALYNVMLTDRILSLGILAVGLSHHLRNAMAAVKTFLDLTPKVLAGGEIDLEKMRDPDFWRDNYQKVQSQMDKVAHLLSDLWEPAEKSVGDFPDKVNLHQILGEAAGKLKGDLVNKGIAVENRIPTDLPDMNVDRPKFLRLFEMLLKDEASALPKGGSVKFTAKLLNPQEVQLEVEDNGLLRSQDAFKSLFDPFFAINGYPQDFGFYLLTCFFMVYHHGGRIIVKRMESRGNFFTITLPLIPPALPPETEDVDFINKIPDE